MRFRRTRDKNISAIDITPLVDVVFLLLIFFMLSLGSPLKISEVNLPESTSGEALSKQAITVVISSENILVDGQIAQQESLKTLPFDQDIVVLAYRDIPYYRVIQVLDTLRSSRHERISLATKPIRD
ncbi:MAG TPA: biopolymer transporter ExbD [Deltaproteobacteria bacterium]|nr:biopolymer transporter ExbD [Deltaproteobacteria bacterium]HPJ94111.1 biopolymer transporter ExbD [Deltaproteobacteria bacterium]HPR52817.1 biopolymer transporter ExbD [Deltaproteobacteria bacterium]